MVERKLMIPMRDGVRMQFDVYRPKNVQRAPAIFVRTPYNMNYWDVNNGAPADMSSQLDAVQRGYAYVMANGLHAAQGDSKLLGDRRGGEFLQVVQQDYLALCLRQASEEAHYAVTDFALLEEPVAPKRHVVANNGVRVLALGKQREHRLAMFGLTEAVVADVRRDPVEPRFPARRRLSSRRRADAHGGKSPA